MSKTKVYGITTWSTKKLIEEGNALWQSIYQVGCYGVKDMILLGLIERELNRRGYEFKENIAFEIVKK